MSSDAEIVGGMRANFLKLLHSFRQTTEARAKQNSQTLRQPHKRYR